MLSAIYQKFKNLLHALYSFGVPLGRIDAWHNARMLPKVCCPVTRGTGDVASVRVQAETQTLRSSRVLGPACSPSAGKDAPSLQKKGGRPSGSPPARRESRGVVAYVSRAPHRVQHRAMRTTRVVAFGSLFVAQI